MTTKTAANGKMMSMCPCLVFSFCAFGSAFESDMRIIF